MIKITAKSIKCFCLIYPAGHDGNGCPAKFRQVRADIKSFLSTAMHSSDAS